MNTVQLKLQQDAPFPERKDAGADGDDAGFLRRIRFSKKRREPHPAPLFRFRGNDRAGGVKPATVKTPDETEIAQPAGNEGRRLCAQEG